MFIDPSRRHNDYDVALHRTPNGVRCPFTSTSYKHRTPSGVVSFFYKCQMIIAYLADGSLPVALPELRRCAGRMPVKGRLLVAVCELYERRLLPCPAEEGHASR